MAGMMLSPEGASVRFIPADCISVLRIDDSPEARQAINDYRRMFDPQPELPFPRVPQPEQLCLKFR